MVSHKEGAGYGAFVCITHAIALLIWLVMWVSLGEWDGETVLIGVGAAGVHLIAVLMIGHRAWPLSLAPIVYAVVIWLLLTHACFDCDEEPLFGAIMGYATIIGFAAYTATILCASIVALTRLATRQRHRDETP